MWNLITLNRRGTDADNSNLWIPNIIEAQYSVGYDWGRFAEFRVSKTLDKNFTLALGIANPSLPQLRCHRGCLRFGCRWQWPSRLIAW